ncbi:MAG: indolepyruvate ferredoxin oxidoreductase family protein, partial [Rhodoferax sp.]|nr:indolepyruvate ferredoxin oxidoreductase family protein [Rhodoferax sp.]
YEVARLHSDGTFAAKVAAQFEGDYQLRYHLAPPLFARRNDKGELQKTSFGPWMGQVMKVLARLKFLRGTPLDVFGYSAERRTERALITEYRQTIESLLPNLTLHNRAQATTFARLPEQIRGFGHVKARHLAAVRGQWRSEG